MKTQQLTPKMIEALLAAADGPSARNMHGTYKALLKRGLVDYVWGQPHCWVITPAGVALAAEIREPAQ